MQKWIVWVLDPFIPLRLWQAGIAYIKELQGGHGVCAVSANYAADLKRFLTSHDVR